MTERIIRNLTIDEVRGRFAHWRQNRQGKAAIPKELWVLMGRTTGRGKASNSYTPNRSIKEVLGLALTQRFRELLSQL